MFQSTRPHGARLSANGWPSITLVFQSTRPHGARRVHAAARPRMGCFNPRARTGRDCAGCASILPRALFQSTRPHGARPRASRRSGAMSWFQSTRPHGARQQSSALGSECVRFNPRARTGRDVRLHAVRGCEVVSIHAPARGATPDGGAYSYEALFQSTRPHGARRGRALGAVPQGSVSIHAPARGATPWTRCPRVRWTVSIHAPARGATGGLSCHGAYSSVSIHAPARGATSVTRAKALQVAQFQSTRPHGARRGTYRAISPL